MNEQLVKINVSSGCYCNVLHCEHQFRLWSKLWFEGVRKRMPLIANYPGYLFRTTA